MVTNGPGDRRRCSRSFVRRPETRPNSPTLPNYAIAFVILKKFDERHISAKQIADTMAGQAQHDPGRPGFRDNAARRSSASATGAGYSLFVEDRAGSGYGVLQQGVVARCKVR